MKEKFQQVIKHGIVYGLGNMGQQIIGFLLLPVYTTNLSADEYGRLALINTTSALLQVLLNAGISYSIFKYYFKAESHDQRREVISSALLWLLGIGFLFWAVMWVLSAPIAGLITGSRGDAAYFKVMAGSLAFTLPQVIPLGIFRAQKKSAHYAILTVSNFLVGMTLNIYFVASLKLGIFGVLLAGAFTSFFFLLLGLYYCRNFIGPVFSGQLIFSMLKFGSPMLVSGLSNYVLRQADRWFLNYYTSFDVLGVYSLGYKIGEIINLLFAQPLTLIWVPVTFEMENHPNAKKFYETALTYTALLGFWLALGLSLFGEEIMIFMATPEYYGSNQVIPWVSASYVLYACYFVVNIGILLKNKTSYSVLIVGSSGIANIIFNYLLIRPFGGLGAAQATLLSYLVMFLVAYVINHRFLSLSYEWKRLGLIAAIFLLLLVAGFQVSGGIVLSIAIKALLLLGYWFVMFLIRFYTPEEISWIRAALQKYIYRTYPKAG